MGDLWDGGPRLVGGVELRFWRDIQNISHPLIAGSDITQSIHPSINLWQKQFALLIQPVPLKFRENIKQEAAGQKKQDLMPRPPC